jgi:hypothetical protein
MNAASPPVETRGWPIGRAILVSYGIAAVGAGAAVVTFWLAIDYMAAHHLGEMMEWGAGVVFGVAIVAIAWSSTLLCQRLAGGRLRTAASRRYRRRMWIIQLVYLVAILAAAGGYQLLPRGSLLMWPLAVAPALAVIGFIVTMALYLRDEKDELERAIQSEAALWATGGALALATVWGFLELFDLVPHAQGWAVFMVWSLLLAPAQAMVRGRYQ